MSRSRTVAIATSAASAAGVAAAFIAPRHGIVPAIGVALGVSLLVALLGLIIPQGRR